MIRIETYVKHLVKELLEAEEAAAIELLKNPATRKNLLEIRMKQNPEWFQKFTERFGSPIEAANKIYDPQKFENWVKPFRTETTKENK